MPNSVNPEHFERLLGVYNERLDDLDLVEPGYRETFNRFSQLVCEPNQLVVALPYVDEYLEAYITHGQRYEGNVELVRGEPNRCHENAARLWLTGDAEAIITGYALSCDGLWRQHSVAVDTGGNIIETTTAREAYHMAHLSDVGAWMFTSDEIEWGEAVHIASEERRTTMSACRALSDGAVTRWVPLGELTAPVGAGR